MVNTHRDARNGQALRIGRILFGLLRRDLARLTLASLATCVLVLTLAWWAPAQRELDIAAYKHAVWTVETPISAAPADVPRIQQDFGSGNILLGSWWYAPLSTTDGKEIAVSAVVTLTPDSPVGIFPAEERIALHPVQGGSWIDIDASVARALGVDAGDTVMFGGLEASSRAAFTIRGVYAVAPVQSLSPVVFVNGSPIRSELAPTKDEPHPITVAWVKGLTVGDVLAKLHEPFYKSRLLEDGYNFSDKTVEDDAFGIRSRESWLTGAEDHSLAKVAIITGISIFAAAAMVALLWREISVFAGRASRRAWLLHRLGVSRRRLAAAAGGLAAVSVAVSVIAGSAVALRLLSGFVTIAFPPTLLPAFVGVGAAIVVVVVLGCLATLRTRLSAGRTP